MKVKIIAVGKINSSAPESILIEKYKKRILYKLDIKEVASKDSKEQEAEEILKLLNKESFVICLDETGEEYTSKEFSKKIESLSLYYSQIIFLIGGAEGHTHKVRNNSNLIMSLGKMTWPHKLIRAMLLEQLYRAQTILNHHPYHK